MENTMPATADIDVLHAALKEAEDELCALGHTLVHEGRDTGTIALTLDVIRIALYGSDGAGHGVEGFDPARARLAAMRAEEARRQREADRHARILRRLELAARRLQRAKGKQEKSAATYWAVIWLMATGVRPFPASEQ
jgi:hypothetical protein